MPAIQQVPWRPDLAIKEGWRPGSMHGRQRNAGSLRCRSCRLPGGKWRWNCSWRSRMFGFVGRVCMVTHSFDHYQGIFGTDTFFACGRICWRIACDKGGLAFFQFFFTQGTFRPQIFAKNIAHLCHLCCCNSEARVRVVLAQWERWRTLLRTI